MKPKFMRTKIPSSEIYTIIFGHLGYPSEAKTFLWGISDQFFYHASEEEILKVIHTDKTEKKIYVPNVGDCDNYAFELRAAFGRKGWPVGILYVDTPFGLHAVFFYITEGRVLKVIEPQTDEFFDKIKSVIGIIMY